MRAGGTCRTKLMYDSEAFFNDGFGWVCRACSSETSESAAAAPRSRLLSEGEAEGKQPQLSHKALARWADSNRTTLLCPRCGVSARVNRS
ncbi:MAG TPA: hypothetical protein DEA22_12960 [Blastocatellia bacterium]|nr:hypothetical protein [Blastocatellia bacterium]